METCRRCYSEVQPRFEIGNIVSISLINDDGNPSPLHRLRTETLTCGGTKIRAPGNIASIRGKVSASTIQSAGSKPALHTSNDPSEAAPQTAQ